MSDPEQLEDVVYDDDQQQEAGEGIKPITSFDGPSTPSPGTPTRDASTTQETPDRAPTTTELQSLIARQAHATYSEMLMLVTMLLVLPKVITSSVINVLIFVFTKDDTDTEAHRVYQSNQAIAWVSIGLLILYLVCFLGYCYKYLRYQMIAYDRLPRLWCKPKRTKPDGSPSESRKRQTLWCYLNCYCCCWFGDPNIKTKLTDNRSDPFTYNSAIVLLAYSFALSFIGTLLVLLDICQLVVILVLGDGLSDDVKQRLETVAGTVSVSTVSSLPYMNVLSNGRLLLFLFVGFDLAGSVIVLVVTIWVVLRTLSVAISTPADKWMKDSLPLGCTRECHWCSWPILLCCGDVAYLLAVVWQSFWCCICCAWGTPATDDDARRGCSAGCNVCWQSFWCCACGSASNDRRCIARCNPNWHNTPNAIQAWL